jgi:class 3 adenylate cyclase
MPAHLAERILAARADLAGERKQVTVLFADVAGSTALIQGLDPEEADQLLTPAVQAMVDAVHRYEGTVNRVHGEGVMALFGAPLAHEDHAVRACYAALALQEAIKRYAERVRREHGVLLQARVGLNSGEVVIRAIGSDLHVEYDAVGPTTHLAARMEQLAAPGTVQLAPATLALAEGRVQVRSLGPVPVKGLPAPIEVFELLGAGQSRTRLQAAAARGLTRFVGRQAELETLRRALELASRGHGQIVAVVGEPGSASRASSGSSPTPIAPTAGSCSSPARCRTAGRRPTCR